MRVDASLSEGFRFQRLLKKKKRAFGAIISLSPIRSQQAEVTAPAEISRNHNYYYNQPADSTSQRLTPRRTECRLNAVITELKVKRRLRMGRDGADFKYLMPLFRVVHCPWCEICASLQNLDPKLGFNELKNERENVKHLCTSALSNCICE